MALSSYESVLLSNASQITAVESSLRSLTYFLPGRFKDAELAGEALYSALNLLGLYHDEILKRLVCVREIDAMPTTAAAARRTRTEASTAMVQGPLLPHTPSQHARYTNHFMCTSSTYKVLARALVIIGYGELLAEMVARRRLSKQRAWDVVLGIEAVKASIRISLYHITTSRLSIQPPMPEREVDPALLEERRREATLAELRAASTFALAQGNQRAENIAQSLTAGAESRQSGPAKSTWTGTRTGYVRPTLASLQPRQDRPIDPMTGKPVPLNLMSSSQSTSRSHSRSRSRLSASRSSIVGDDSDSSSESDSSEETLVEPSAPTEPTPWTDSSIQDLLAARALSKEDVIKPFELVRSLGSSKRGALAEYLWMLRPVLYVLALKKWGRSRWEPWVISLSTEYLSHVFRSSAYLSSPSSSPNPNAGLTMLLTLLSTQHPLLRFLSSLFKSSLSTPQPQSSVEGEEWTRRRRAFLWYLLRGPLWETWTRVKVEALCQKVEKRFLLGLGANVVREYLPLVDQLYFYTASQ